MTEGYLWTGQYPEAQRIINSGNNQSMELDEKNINAHWAKDEIDIACTYGVINGFEDNTFRPDEFITREQVAKIISNYNNK